MRRRGEWEEPCTAHSHNRRFPCRRVPLGERHVLQNGPKTASSKWGSGLGVGRVCFFRPQHALEGHQQYDQPHTD